MTTVRDLISDALIEAGAKAVGESVSADDASFALRTLNRMLSVWNTDYGMVHFKVRTELSLVAGQQKYTLGIGGNWNISDPAKIDMLSILIPGDQPTETEVNIINADDWRAIAVKDVTSTIPTDAWVTGASPLNEIYLWPIPSDSTYKAVLYYWGKLPVFASLNDSVELPEAYEEAVLTNLAIHLCSSYGIQPNPVIAGRASRSKDLIRSINSDPPYMKSDLSGGSSKAGRTFGRIVD